MNKNLKISFIIILSIIVTIAILYFLLKSGKLGGDCCAFDKKGNCIFRNAECADKLISSTEKNNTNKQCFKQCVYI